MKFFKTNVINLFDCPEDEHFEGELNYQESSTEFIFTGEFIDRTSFYKIDDFSKKTGELSFIK